MTVENKPTENLQTSSSNPEGEATPTTTPTTFTQADIDRIVSQRLSRERKNWDSEVQTKQAEAAEAAKLSETERYQKELEKSKAQMAELTAKLERSERLQQLQGKVADPAMALKLLEQEHLGEDGMVDVSKLLKQYPILAPASPQPEAANPIARAGIPAGNVGMATSGNPKEGATQALKEGNPLAYINALLGG